MLFKDFSNLISGTLDERKADTAIPFTRIFFIFNRRTFLHFEESFEALRQTITIITKDIQQMGLFPLKVRLMRDSQRPRG